MHTEDQSRKIQYILPNVQPDTIREKLTTMGAECIIPLRRIQRHILSIPQDPSSYIRIQYENNKNTTSFKRNQDVWWGKIEVFIDNIELMKKIYLKCGLGEKSMQEFYRETWHFRDIYLDIERWPWLHPFLKMRWTDTKTLDVFLELIGSHSCNVLFDATSMDVYKRELWIDRSFFQNMPTISFDCPPTSEKE